MCLNKQKETCEQETQFTVYELDMDWEACPSCNGLGSFESEEAFGFTICEECEGTGDA